VKVYKIGLVAALFLSIPSVVLAVEQYGPAYGGTGGSDFDSLGCNMGSMSGAQIRSGERVDAIGARCYQDSPINSVLRGSSTGGTLSISDCAGTTPFVKGIIGRSGSEVDAFGIMCTDVTKASAKTMLQYGGTGGSSFSYTCASGFSVKAFYGRSGKRIDRIGVICSDRAENSSGL
jgi:hypothetical protein